MFDKAPVVIRSDAVGSYSFTEKQVADSMTDILAQVTKIHLNKCANEVMIVDCTAGVGGNTLSFANAFRGVLSVEINKQRSMHLIHNVNSTGITNVQVFNSNVLHLLHTDMFKNIHVFFIDPPWGGITYKYKHNVQLFVSGVRLRSVIARLCKHAMLDRIVGIKVPYNFEFQVFKDEIRSFADVIYICPLHKMVMIVLILHPRYYKDDENHASVTHAFFKS